jgi:plastocyanin
MRTTPGRRAVVALAALASTVLLSGTAVAGGGCMHGSPPTDGTGTTVEMVDACFTPTVLHVARGAEVTFVNRDEGMTHNVVGVGDTWGSFGELSFGEAASYRFDANGVYLYSCFLHEGMVGAVVVGDGSGAANLQSVHAAAATDTIPGGSGPAAVATSSGSETRLATSAVAFLVLVGMGTTILIVRARRRSVPAA